METQKTETTRGGRREGAGRPAKAEEDKTKQRAIYLTDKEWDHCNREWMQGVKASEYVRRLIEADMKRHNK